MILYKLVNTYIKVGLFFFYKKITISGKENIPNNGPILFVANHQNAMMDPLIVGTKSGKVMYFLARASAFKNKIAAKLLRAIHAIAIYRVRDGVDSKAKNEAVFKECLNLFNKGENMLIFPEGSHSIKRQVRSLRAGFVRMTFDYLKENPQKDLRIIPIGLNYDNTINYAKELHVIYGKPISTRQFFNEKDVNKSQSDLINKVHQQLKRITVHIEDENYEAKFDSLTEKDFLTPIKSNERLKRNNSQVASSNNSKSKNLFYYLMQLNSIFPFLIWKGLEPKIAAREFISTAKFSLGLTAFPLFYFIQTLLVYRFFGSIYALLYVALTFILVFLSTKTR